MRSIVSRVFVKDRELGSVLDGMLFAFESQMSSHRLANRHGFSNCGKHGEKRFLKPHISAGNTFQSLKMPQSFLLVSLFCPYVSGKPQQSCAEGLAQIRKHIGAGIAQALFGGMR